MPVIPELAERPATATRQDAAVPSARGPRSPLRAATLTFYLTLVCLAVLVPSALVSTLNDAPRSTLTEGAAALAESLAANLERTGLPEIYRAARERFRAISCGSPTSANPC